MGHESSLSLQNEPSDIGGYIIKIKLNFVEFILIHRIPCFFNMLVPTEEGNENVAKWLEDSSSFNCSRLESQTVPNEHGKNKIM